MKFKSILYSAFLVGMVGCADLDLNPLSEGSSEAWYSNATEVEMSVNEVFSGKAMMMPGRMTLPIGKP